MRSFLFLLPCFFAQLLCAHFDYFDSYVGVGYRQDNLKWSIADPSGSPNVLSELSWKDLRSVQVTADVRGQLLGWYLRGDADYGKIFHGTNSDRDFHGENKTGEYLRSDNKADRGEVFDLSGGVGYSKSFCCNRLLIAGLVGYSHHEQHLHMRKGYVTLSTESKYPTGPFHGLHSTYKTKWNTLWLGLDFDLQVCEPVVLFGTYEFHWARYRAKGHWNLRGDLLDDFHHAANGVGNKVQIGLSYEIHPCWNVTLVGNYQAWETRQGRDRTLFEDMGELFLGETRLNRVKWHSFSISCAIGFDF